MSKNPTSWSGNISAKANEGTYDSATDAYDSATDNYDGVVAGDLADNEKTPLAWNKTAKNTTVWSKPSKTPTSWATP